MNTQKDTQNETQNEATTPTTAPVVETAPLIATEEKAPVVLAYSELLEAIKIAPDEVTKNALEVQISQIENVLSEKVVTASGARVNQQFANIKTLVDTSKAIDLVLEDLVYFLTDCESNTVRQYKDYLISENRSFEQVKTLELMTKKQIFKLLVDDVNAQFRKHLEGANFFDEGHIKALRKPLSLICDHYQWVIDLQFNQTVDNPKARLELLRQIARNEAIDNHSKELKIFKLDAFLEKGIKEPVFTKGDIKSLNTAMGRHGFYLHTATTLSAYIKDELDREAKNWADYEEKEKQIKAQKAQEAIKAKAIQDFLSANKISLPAPTGTDEAPATIEE